MSVQATPTPTLKNTPIKATPTELKVIPTATRFSCLTQPGEIEIHEIRHPDLVAPLRVRVYLPPCYEQDLYASYPSLLLLHGLQATDAQWDELGVDEFANQLIQGGDSPPFIVLMPWIRITENPSTAIMQALLPYAEAQWRLAPQREFWGIGGISRGAGQALQIGLLNPDQFGAISLHSPAILNPVELLIQWHQAIEPNLRPALWFDIGESDSLTETAVAFLEQFQAAGIALTYQINQGDHLPSYWRERLPNYLAWHRSQWLRGSSLQP
jgi:enterochelin esterase-like enzyme